MTAERLKPTVGEEKKNFEARTSRVKKARRFQNTGLLLTFTHGYRWQTSLNVLDNSRHGHLGDRHLGLPAVREFGGDDRLL